MAVINPTITRVKGDDNLLLVTWNLTTADTTGTGWEFTDYADITWHASATNWGSATATIQGANTDVDGAYGSLTDAGSTAITFTGDAASPEVSLPRPRFVRPKLTTAGTAAVVAVTAMARRNPRKP